MTPLPAAVDDARLAGAKLVRTAGGTVDLWTWTWHVCSSKLQSSSWEFQKVCKRRDGVVGELVLLGMPPGSVDRFEVARNLGGRSRKRAS